MFSFEYGVQFALEFEHYPIDQQDAITDFLYIYQQNGLKDFTKYQGKIAPSWRGIDKTDPIYDFTFSHNLWHYHLGLPEYIQSLYHAYCNVQVKSDTAIDSLLFICSNLLGDKYLSFECSRI